MWLVPGGFRWRWKGSRAPAAPYLTLVGWTPDRHIVLLKVNIPPAVRTSVEQGTLLLEDPLGLSHEGVQVGLFPQQGFIPVTRHDATIATVAAIATNLRGKRAFVAEWFKDLQARAPPGLPPPYGTGAPGAVLAKPPRPRRGAIGPGPIPAPVVFEEATRRAQATARRSAGVASAPEIGKRDDIFIDGAPLTEQEKRYCRCVIDVAAKNPPECFNLPSFAVLPSGQRCVSSYAICSASVGKQANCGAWYDFSKFSDTRLEAYARLRRLPIAAQPYHRGQYLAALAADKAGELGSRRRRVRFAP